MAFNKDQNDFPLPAGNNEDRSAANFLPKYFRTDTNKKFVNSTIDQMINQGVIEKINAFAGRRYAKATTAQDSYLTDISVDRENYQFEPVTVYKDDLSNVEFLKDYNDYISQIQNFKGTVSNHSILNSQEFYSWDPHIDWDKFANFREYYWLPNGPSPIAIVGQSREVASTYTVTLVEDDDNYAYVFNPNGFTRNPTLKLYRGQTYRFEINTPGHPLAFAVLRTFVDTDPTVGVDFVNESSLYRDGVVSETEYVENGVIEFTIPDNAPDTLYYISKNDVNTSGIFAIYNIEENTEIDIELEIIGKKTYKTSTGIEFSNGMKVYFQGTTIPESYQNGYYYVEGVGSEIKLVLDRNLEVPAIFTSEYEIPFDDENIGFDQYPFEDATSFPAIKDYIVVNRSSADRNPWSRYNRWFHREVIEQCLCANNLPVDIDETARAKRPIIEFEAGLKLYNHGTQAKNNIDLVDTFTKDVFSTIEGSLGYNVDGVDLVDGMRVLFTADTDILVNGRIYEVNFILHRGRRQISLVATSDSMPVQNETVLVKNGNIYKGRMFYYDREQWKQSQDKTSINQTPLFDLFDQKGLNFADNIQYPSSTFSGNKVFSYRVGSGTNDVELGFPLTFKNISNVGDIVFDFNLLSESTIYQNSLNEDLILNSDVGFLKKYNKNGDDFVYVNGWKKAKDLSEQPVIRQYSIINKYNNFEVDVFDNSGTLDDLRVKVYLNGILKIKNVDYTLENINNITTVVFVKNLSVDDVLLLKCYSKTNKNQNGFYEIPPNLEKNPLNNNIKEFTLGEVNDHIGSIVEDHPSFAGIYPGVGNLRDIGDLTEYGKRFVQHSGPINLALYHLTDKDANIIKSLKYARKEYAKFKRKFLTEAEKTGFHGSSKDHVDLILSKIVNDRISTMPFFFGDMVGFGAFIKTIHDIEYNGPAYFALSEDFDLTALSSRAVYVYRNGNQLLHGKDYNFTNGFVYVTLELQDGDIVEVYEYESTNGSFIPPTPTKLGLYPKYQPSRYLDNTYKTPRTVIQGHDGSIVVAFNDYRDDLLLELENRIYNTIKVEYNQDILDIHSFIGGFNRNTNFAKSDIDNAMLADFAQWTEISGSPNYSVHDFWNQTDSFSYNYSFMTDRTGNPLEGFWRNIYKKYFDTDRPHTHPWEMLGYTIQPTWWETVYGPAPYTKDNLILWNDLQEGIIREPGKLLIRNSKYYRPGLLEFLPVDEFGRLLSPLDSGLAQNFSLTYTESSFEFGDHAPIETAWRRSSEYPFSLITAWVLLQPAKVLGLGYDFSRIKRDVTGNLIYTATQKRLRTEDIVFSSVKGETPAVLTSGLLNYINNYMISKVTSKYTRYKEILTKIDNQLAIKLGGFADKTKLKLVLDSRSPLNKSSVFVPDENYQIVLNTSSTLDIVTLSGIIIEKTETGYIISGYDKEDPIFTYNQPIKRQQDSAITVGGISEKFITWRENQEYPSGTIVFYENAYYRTKITHVSNNTFDATKFVVLLNLPTVGGITALLRKGFENQVSRLPYGTLLTSVQEVVDFMLGYENYLIEQGFKFEFFNNNTQALEDMQLCIREFMFWVTQNWDIGTVLTVSPVANRVIFERPFYVVDNVYDNFYDYNLLTGDGSRLNKEFSNIFRNSANEFNIKPINIEEGIYLVKLPLVQKEHVVLIDNQTVFNDTIFDTNTGYRQERIKVVGYRTDEWTGSLNIPGFFYDEAKVRNWNIWSDYSIGDLVKYKEFYYSANEKHTSNEFFDANKWNILSERPEAELLPNWDYRVNQFTDFYSLDTDNFDTEQQRLGQHLIGYQKREYLANIITDSVSQYKFYQGMIQDKGTKNALTKLFDALSSADKDSLEFYEEWAIRLGQYGATENLNEIEYELDESKYRLEPQLFELVNNLSISRTDLVYEIVPFQTFLKPFDYNHQLFTNSDIDTLYSKDNGYVRNQDVNFVAFGKDQILNLPIDSILVGDFIWVQYDNQSWNVLRLHTVENEVVDVIASLPAPNNNSNGFSLYFDRNVNFEIDDLVGIKSSLPDINGFFKIADVSLNRISIITDTPINLEDLTDSTTLGISKLVKRRFADAQDLNENIQELRKERDDIVWLDNTNSKFGVFTNENIFSVQEETSNPDLDADGFSTSFDTNLSNTTIIIGSPGSEVVRVYTRPIDSFEKNLIQTLQPDNTIDNNNLYGFDVSISSDLEFIAIGAPTASNAKTRYVGFVEPGKTFNIGDIVNDRGILWRAKNTISDWSDISGDSSTIQLTDQDWEPVFLLETEEAGTADFGHSNQGAVYLYKRRPDTTYELVHCIVSPNPLENEQFGYKVEIRKTAAGYLRLFVGAPGQNNVDVGRIYFLDNSSGEWAYSRNRDYKGIFTESAKYNTNDIVFYDGKLWTALTNIIPGLSIPGDSKWEENTDTVEHTGYIPHQTATIVEDNNAGIFTDSYNIGKKFDVNNAGNVLIVAAPVTQVNPIFKDKISIFRNESGRWKFSQTIDTTDLSEDFGYAIAINDSGDKIAICAPRNDNNGVDQGVVYLYNQHTANNTPMFELAQTLKSPFAEKNESFGTGVDFSNNKLAISGKNTDVRIETTFDRHTEYLTTVEIGEDNFGNPVYSDYVFDITSKENENKTTFDRNTTKFIQKIEDVGRIALFQQIGNFFIYAEDVSYNRNIKFNDISNFKLSDNHLYIGLPKFNPSVIGDSTLPLEYEKFSDSSAGLFVDLRADKNKDSWAVISEESGKVNISKISRCFLYSKETNDIISSIDIIDPRQGKIAGIAEQNLAYKTFYDPAVYSVNQPDPITGSVQSVVVDNASNWTTNYVGQLWWDLSTASWYNPYQGDIQYRANNWNRLLTNSTIDVYEWVETDFLPEQWLDRADTNDGVSAGISGTPLYNNSVYSFKNVYDPVAGTFSTKYYYWVRNKRVIPGNVSRQISAYDIANIIQDPAGSGYRFVAPLDIDKFAIYNSKGLVKGDDTIVHFSFYKDEQLTTNVHNEYQLITESLETSKINSEIENKWFDSLIGYDLNNNPVPDNTLSVKQKYGILNFPRQSMFVNRLEAVKQFVERTNSVLIENQIVDNYDLSGLSLVDEIPNVLLGKYDILVDTVDELRFVGVAKVEQAVLQPVIVNGRINAINIINSGRGYRVAPEVIINDSTGTGALIKTEINNLGQIIKVTIRSSGKSYSNLTSIQIRKFSVLVRSDSEIGGRWSIFSWDRLTQTWSRNNNQAFDTTRYWNYVDWYATGYNATTAIDQSVNQSYELFGLSNNIGDIVKIKTIGSGGWLLLEKIDDQLTEDYTVNYKTIGRQNGTIQLSTRLYDYASTTTGFDASIYDNTFYDREPVVEMRNILFSLRDSIFVGNLAVEWNKLFFASLRYVFSEQSNVDWAFKTSFVRAKHNLGDLEQKVTFQNDNLENYQDYVHEVKPYHTKVREYISSYTYVEPTRSLTTDFDLPPSYNSVDKIIEPSSAKFKDNTIVGIVEKYLEYPYKNWVDNNAYDIIRIDVANRGQGYRTTPIVTVLGNNETTARAYLSKGSVSAIEITNRGGKYYTAPEIVIDGNLEENGTPASAVAILGNGQVRKVHLTMKFDRVSGSYLITDLNKTEIFTGTGANEKFVLKWPIDIKTGNYKIYVNNVLQLQSEVTVSNDLDNSKGFDRYIGYVEFTEAPPSGSTIEIEYKKDIGLLDAADRINFFYNPTTGMSGKDLSQLMDGVEYSGVNLDSIGFGNEQGFGIGGYGALPWDTFDNTYDDEIFILDGSTLSLELSRPLEHGVEYNFYKNGIRLDDIDYSTSSAQSNENAVMETIVGDGITTTILIDNDLIQTNEGDIIVIRKSTSDGSFTPVATSFDISLSGGNLQYTTATGLSSEDITVDGDGFVTTTTSRGPEELVPGQVLDTLDIQVYHRVSDGAGIIGVANYKLDENTTIFALPSIPQSSDAIIVKLDNEFVNPDRYSINYAEQALEFVDSTMNIGSLLSITTIGTNGTNLLDTNYFVFDGSTRSHVTNISYSGNITAFVTANGEILQSGVEYTLENSTELDIRKNRVKIVFEPTVLNNGDFVQYSLYSTEVKTYSQIIIDNTFEADSVTDYHIFDEIENPVPFNKQPLSHNILVKVNNTVLNPGYRIAYTTTNARTYDIETWQFVDTLLISEAEVLVFADSIQLTKTEFTYDPVNGRITILRNDIAPAGTYLEILVITEAEYYFLDTKIVLDLDVESFISIGDELTIQVESDTYTAKVKSVDINTVVVQSYRKDLRTAFVINNETTISILGEDSALANVTDVSYILSDSLTFAIPPSSGSSVVIYQFSNHDVNNFKRYVYRVTIPTNDADSSVFVPEETADYTKRNLLISGYFKLEGTILSSNYAWVAKNGELLTPEVDYYLTNTLDAIQLTVLPSENDIIDIIQFSNSPITNRFGFRIFKDMLNRTHYKRLNQDNSYILDRPLNYYDTRVVLESTEGIYQPDKARNLPGVIFLEGERIEYFEVSENYLLQLRRGTLGTGIKTIYEEGSIAYGQSANENINYNDTIYTQTFISDGSSTFELDFVPTSIDSFEVIVGGKRLRKNAIQRFNHMLDQDSIDGDETISAEFSLENNIITFNLDRPSSVPLDGEKIQIVRKIGKTWSETGTSLAYANNPIARFLRGATIQLPK